jgi:SHS2 domain-containing protein
MNDQQAAGFREQEHIADWELEVWAPDLPGLLMLAAQGMYALSGARLMPEPRISKVIELDYADLESALVVFLEELLFLGEIEGLGFDEFMIEARSGRIRAELVGAPLAGRDKEIKAVTYHNLAVRKTKRGLETVIVFDV